MAKGLENMIINISGKIGTLEVAIDSIYYGDPTKKSTSFKLPGMQKPVFGILALTQEIAKYDLCNPITTALQNIPISGSVLKAKLDKVKENAKKLSEAIDTEKVLSKAVKSPEKLSKLADSLQELSNSIDSEVASLSPQIVVTKNYIDDIAGSLTNKTYVTGSGDNLNLIPNADVQKIISGIQEVRGTLDTLQNLGTAQDVLNLISKVPGSNIGSNIQDLQRKLNPAQLITPLQQVSTLLRSLNQIGLKVSNYLNILQLISKVQTVLIKVLNVVIRVLELIAIPGLLTVTTVTTKISSTLANIKSKLEAATKLISELNKLIQLIYQFVIETLAKIAEISTSVDTLIFNLEVCKITEDSAMLQNLKDSKANLTDTASKLKDFVKNYNNVDKNRQTYGTYTLQIVEEELVDNGIKYKRRKAVALDQRGVVVAETELTFATDNNILFEEVKLLLQNAGLPIDTGADTGTTVKDAFNTLGVADEKNLTTNARSVQREVNSFVDGIKKGGKKFRRKMRQQLSTNISQTSQEIRASVINNITTSKSKYNIQPQTRTISTGNKSNSNLLSDSQRAKWQAISTSLTAPTILKQKANQILKNDLAAQAEVSMSRS